MTLSPPSLFLSALLVLGVAACDDQGEAGNGAINSSSSDTDPAVVSATADTLIEVRDNSFAPGAAEVAVGEIVTWDFATASVPHDVVFDDEHGSEILREGTWSTSFDEPGTYAYECTLHRGMTGEVTVTD